MDGRRVTRKNQKYNPLFILFLCLVAAVVILLIVSIVLGVRLGTTNAKLKDAEANAQQLQETITQLQEDLEAAKSRIPTTPSVDNNDAPALPGTDIAAGGSWLDLTELDESIVKPENLLSGYETYYTTAGVNLRKGPGTSYNRITTVDFGDKVQVAARENGWSFVSVGTRFGWISSDYLSTTQPSPPRRTEATSGSIRRT